MIESLHVVKDEDAAVTWRKVCNSAIDGETVDRSSLSQIASTESPSSAFFRDIGHQMIERHHGQYTLAQMHQNDIHGEPVQPCRKD